jgi:hypothetical protein
MDADVKKVLRIAFYVLIAILGGGIPGPDC